MVGQRTLDPFILVRIQARQQTRTITLKLGFSYKDQTGLDRHAQPDDKFVNTMIERLMTQRPERGGPLMTVGNWLEI